jgi:hypothetical protein
MFFDKSRQRTRLAERLVKRHQSSPEYTWMKLQENTSESGSMDGQVAAGSGQLGNRMTSANTLLSTHQAHANQQWQLSLQREHGHSSTTEHRQAID